MTLAANTIDTFNSTLFRRKNGTTCNRGASMPCGSWESGSAVPVECRLHATIRTYKPNIVVLFRTTNLLMSSVLRTASANIS